MQELKNKLAKSLGRHYNTTHKKSKKCDIQEESHVIRR